MKTGTSKQQTVVLHSGTHCYMYSEWTDLLLAESIPSIPVTRYCFKRKYT
jgi:hypothetical protein